MNKQPFYRNQVILLSGDIFTLALVTIFGFASHQELGSSGLRIFTTFIPLVAAWLLVAPFLGVFDQGKVMEPGQLWRPFWAMVLAGPFAAWLRGALLNAPILPIFVVVLGGVSALALLVWRSLFWFVAFRKR